MTKKRILALIFCLVLCFSTCLTSSLVFAAAPPDWQGPPPYINPGSPSLSFDVVPSYATANGYQNFAVGGGPYGVYSYSSAPLGSTQTIYYGAAIVWDINKEPAYNSDNAYVYSNSYTYVFNGTSYTIYYKTFTGQAIGGAQINHDGELVTVDYNIFTNGTSTTENFNNMAGAQKIINFFMFGVGDIDYELPPQEIPDEDLDIKGLNCWVINDQQVTTNVGSSIRNRWNQFISTIYQELTASSISDIIDADSNYMNSGYIKTYIPGVSLIWDSPDIAPAGIYDPNNNDYVSYSIWIDGRSEINYKTSTDPIANLLNSQQVSSCAFTKLQIHDAPISANPAATYYYNSNQGIDTVLSFIADNSSFTRPSNFDTYQSLILNTVVSRIYIQAYKADENGDIHRGAISWVDLSSGVPQVYNGTTTDMDEIDPSDSEDGADQTTGQQYTVSGDTIVNGDTITNNNTTIVYPGSGLNIGDGTSFLTAGLALINAVLELIKLLFASLLVPFITLGWTGHF